MRKVRPNVHANDQVSPIAGRSLLQRAQHGGGAKLSTAGRCSCHPCKSNLHAEQAAIQVTLTSSSCWRPGWSPSRAGWSTSLDALLVILGGVLAASEWWAPEGGDADPAVSGLCRRRHRRRVVYGTGSAARSSGYTRTTAPALAAGITAAGFECGVGAHRPPHPNLIERAGLPTAFHPMGIIQGPRWWWGLVPRGASAGCSPVHGSRRRPARR